MNSYASTILARSNSVARHARVFLAVLFGIGLLLVPSIAVAAACQTSLFTSPKIEPQKTLGGLQIDASQIDENAVDLAPIVAAKVDPAQPAAAGKLESIDGESVLPSRSTNNGARLGEPQLGKVGLSPDQLSGPYGPVPTNRQPPIDGRTMFREPPDTNESSLLNQSLPLQYRADTTFPNNIFEGSFDQQPQSSRRVTMPNSGADRTSPNSGAKLIEPTIGKNRLVEINRQSKNYKEDTHEIITERYPDGNIKVVRTITQDQDGNYLNDGGWMMYNRQQQPIASGNFVLGVKQGDWERIHEVGSGGIFSELPFNLFRGPYKSTARFEDDQIDGTWTLSDQAGKIMCVISYRDGVREGIAVWNYPNGIKMREATFENGVPDGYVMQWDERGKPQSQQLYVDGRKIIRKKSTHANQTVASEYVFRDRKLVLQGRDDWWAAKPATYVPTGEPVQHGSVAEWFPNRQPKMTGQYANGLREGRFTWWHPSHNKKAEGEFRDGQRQGLWRYWHESGMKRSEGEFRDDEPFGVWRIWAESGELIDSKTFPLETEAPEPKQEYPLGINLGGVSDIDSADADPDSILSLNSSVDNVDSLKVDVEDAADELNRTADESPASTEDDDQPESFELDVEMEDASEVEDSETNPLEGIDAETVDQQKIETEAAANEIRDPGSIVNDK